MSLLYGKPLKWVQNFQNLIQTSSFWLSEIHRTCQPLRYSHLFIRWPVTIDTCHVSTRAPLLLFSLFLYALCVVQQIKARERKKREKRVIKEKIFLGLQYILGFGCILLSLNLSCERSNLWETTILSSSYEDQATPGTVSSPSSPAGTAFRSPSQPLSAGATPQPPHGLSPTWKSVSTATPDRPLPPTAAGSSESTCLAYGSRSRRVGLAGNGEERVFGWWNNPFFFLFLFVFYFFFPLFLFVELHCVWVWL